MTCLIVGTRLLMGDDGLPPAPSLPDSRCAQHTASAQTVIGEPTCPSQTEDRAKHGPQNHASAHASRLQKDTKDPAKK